MFKLSGFFDEISSDLSAQLATMQTFGVKYLCPRNVNEKNIAKYTAAEFRRDILPVLQQAGVTLSSIGSPIGKIALDDEDAYQQQLTQLRELLLIAQEMQCQYIRIFSFFVPKGNPAPLHDKVVKKLEGFLKLAEGSGITLMHENEKKIYGDTPERALALYQTLEHPQFRLCYDASNYIQCGVDPWKAYQQTKAHTVYYHMKDCIDGVEVPLGTGQGHIRDILADLEKSGYSGFLTMEPHTMLYAMTKIPLFLIPFATFSTRGRVYRKIDRAMGIGALQPVSRDQAFRWQYEQLTKLIDGIGGQYE